MLDFQRDFIEFAIQSEVLRFGTFTLKSGRQSPYFFNAGLFNHASALARLGRFYAAALLHHKLPHDMIFGPAYKGIPLVSALAVQLAEQHQIDVPFAFNRKEAKDHGEGGNIVGAPLQGRVLIVDDVMTAGTAIREVIDIIRNAGATPSGVLVALDRQERGQGERSAIQEIEADYGIPVRAIVQLDQVLEYLKSDENLNRYVDAVAEYRNLYGV
ncbi:orotate phosphoribosyltransferase [Hahella sp. SMD15-11]|uniref:Orotate phosphoribosyltransferase n=1 Tax=Thermohahella caldifontis TaxID=3142973 RepID=A0AB39V0K1_9GAMM